MFLVTSLSNVPRAELSLAVFRVQHGKENLGDSLRGVLHPGGPGHICSRQSLVFLVSSTTSTIKDANLGFLGYSAVSHFSADATTIYLHCRKLSI